MTKINFRKITLLVIFLFGFTFVNAQQSNNFEISKNIEIYVDIMRTLNQNYADNINPGELNKAAIDAMLATLDPYTVYIPESQLEDFELMTKGEYGGIGALIQKQGDFIVITEPYEGFPAQKAGLKPGDKIIEVDGESAQGRNSSEVSEKLKGVPGTSLLMVVQPYGDTISKTVELVREKVKFPNIPYSGMLDENIGYISLSQFNQNAANEVKNAFIKLRDSNDLKGLILDLRDNGGGLLNEAVDIVNIFVPKGEIVVTTKSKLSENVMVHRTKSAPEDTKIPLAVLVNGNSASASEIVAGAIQDLDRGVVIGSRTFGKGLVQNVLPLPYNSKLKITISKYYIPSGRCIQAIDYFQKNNNGKSDKVPDSLISAFKTRGGRTVFDGGGIEPDIVIKPESYSQITGDLYAQNYFFNYGNEFYLKNENIAPPEEFVISDETYNNFKSYVSNKDFDYKTETEVVLEELKSSSEREEYYTVIAAQLEALDNEIKQEKKKDIEKHKDEIEELLMIEIVSRYYYQKGKIIVSLRNDPDTDEAIRVLTDAPLYDSILNGSYVAKKD
ncbi:MAG TPA: S41 family peptidase [Bacteroidales bacterium]